MTDLERIAELVDQRNHAQERWDDSRARVLELEQELAAVKTGVGIANPYLVKDQIIKKLQAENEKILAGIDKALDFFHGRPRMSVSDVDHLHQLLTALKAEGSGE